MYSMKEALGALEKVLSVASVKTVEAGDNFGYCSCVNGFCLMTTRLKGGMRKMQQWCRENGIHQLLSVGRMIYSPCPRIISSKSLPARWIDLMKCLSSAVMRIWASYFSDCEYPNSHLLKMILDIFLGSKTSNGTTTRRVRVAMVAPEQVASTGRVREVIRCFEFIQAT